MKGEGPEGDEVLGTVKGEGPEGDGVLGTIKGEKGEKRESGQDKR